MRGGAIGSLYFLAFLLFHFTFGQNASDTSQSPLFDTNREEIDDKTGDDEVTTSSAEIKLPQLEDKESDIDYVTQDVLEARRGNTVEAETEQGELSSIEPTPAHEEQVSSDKQLKSGGDDESEGEESRFSSAHASASSSNGFSQANTFSDGSFGVMPPYGFLSPDLLPSSTQAFGNAQATASSGNPFFESFSYSAPSSPYLGLGTYSSADAIAQTQGDYNRWNPFMPSGYFPDVSYTSAAAQADAGGWNSHDSSFFNPDSSYTTAVAQADLRSGWDPYGPGIYPSNGLSAAEAQATSVGFYSPGQDEIVCRRPGDLYSILTLDSQCLICTCSEVLGQLLPVCVGCDSCFATPIPVPEPEPLPVPIPLPPLPPPEPQHSCSPLPDDTPFQNPLNPCQICICQHVFNAIGQPDIQINCEENPDCDILINQTRKSMNFISSDKTLSVTGTPFDISPIPPIPVPPQPVPMPLCEKFPPDIFFPHPTESCTICQCIVEVLPFGIPEQRILCMPNPDCEEPWSIPEPWPIPEPLEPWPIVEPMPPSPEPWPIPEFVPPVPEPLPTPEFIPPEPELLPIPEFIPAEPEPWPIPEFVPIIPEPLPLPEIIPQEPEQWPVPEFIPAEPEPWPIPGYLPSEPEPWLIPEPLPPVPEPWPTPDLLPPAPEPWPIPEFIPSELEPLPISQDSPLVPWPSPEFVPSQPEPWPVPEYIPLQPEPWPSPELPPTPEIWPLPEPIPVAPEPWPIIETPELWPVPLPESDLLPQPIIPEPHESCRPYPPNIPFQHPWDECRICVCSEFHARGITNIEVNCNTKPSCCVELPFPEPNPQPLPLPSPILQPHQSCQYQEMGSEFIALEDVCKVCTCQLYGNFVAPVCRRSSRPEYLSYLASGSFSSADAIASAQANSYGLTESLAQAQAQAASDSLYNPASAEAIALTQALSSVGSSSAFAESFSNTGNEYPFGVVFPGSIEATASAQSNALINIPPDTNAYPFYETNSYGAAGSQVTGDLAYSQALASATQSPLGVLGSQSYATADSFGNGQMYTGLYEGYPFYGGMPGIGQIQPSPGAPQLYPGLFQYPYGQMPELLPPGIGGWDRSILGQTGGSGVQSLREISAMSGRPLIRSGPGLCKYSGDKYHHNCQACFCFQDASVTICQLTLTPLGLEHPDVIDVAGFGDAEHRGDRWYEYVEDSSGQSGSDLKTSASGVKSSSISSGSGSVSSSLSSEASSIETKEVRLATKTYRQCTPCPHDMMKKYVNFGIKWICASYQRARRSFKSECMMRYRNCQDGTMDLSSALIENATVMDINNNINGDTRRRKNKLKEISTSSSEGDIKSGKSSKDERFESLDISASSTSSSEKRHHPKSSKERRGWRKWHRKCTPCPDDMVKKWKDPTIEWICGGYQRARRSFKSLCMMHYRNCQDGTMFVKIHDNRCPNSTSLDQPYGVHFFYDYDVKSRSSKTSDSTIESDSSSDIYDL
ncbi:unnamed protein product [Leptosia nina]|uniref:Uncharacterized protein n=1 Tax=Leptosia nina TaxID=320188 RepID=A0AAV1JBZ2_9NEOP